MSGSGVGLIPPGLGRHPSPDVLIGPRTAAAAAAAFAVAVVAGGGGGGVGFRLSASGCGW